MNISDASSGFTRPSEAFDRRYEFSNAESRIAEAVSFLLMPGNLWETEKKVIFTAFLNFNRRKNLVSMVGFAVA